MSFQLVSKPIRAVPGSGSDSFATQRRIRVALDLEPGDLLFLYTDGLTSACGPDQVQFEERLTDELAALAGESPAVLVSRVRDVVLELCRGELRDDVTMLALRVGEPPG